MATEDRIEGCPVCEAAKFIKESLEIERRLANCNVVDELHLAMRREFKALAAWHMHARHPAFGSRL